VVKSRWATRRNLVAPLGPLNLITGPNRSGKSNVYGSGRGGSVRRVRTILANCAGVWIAPRRAASARLIVIEYALVV
jgi:hypothetical protein